MLKLKDMKGKVAVLLNLNTTEPYWLHFLDFSIVDEKSETIYKELSAVKELIVSNTFEIVPSDIFHNLSPYPDNIVNLPKFDIKMVANYLGAHHQIEKRKEIQKDRQEWVKIIKDYLTRSFDERIFATQEKIMVARAENNEADAQRLERESEELERIKKEKIENVERMAIVRTGPICHIASFFVLPPGDVSELSKFLESVEEKEKSEKKAMEIALEYERARGWEPEDVSKQNLGFDIRSLSPADPKTGHRVVRRIEVKGRKKGENIRLTVNEWLKAKQLKDTYWLYVVWNPTNPDYEILAIQDPAHKLEYAVKEIKAISHYEINGKEIEKFK